MILYVIATSRRVNLPSLSSADRVLRLAGVSQAAEIPPNGLIPLCDQAMARVRDVFPSWLWKWVNDQDLLNIHRWMPSTSWWWYSELSEMSPLRSHLIRQLYWLTLYRMILQAHQPLRVVWMGDDADLAQSAKAIAEQCGIPFLFQRSFSFSKQAVFYAWLRRIYFSFKKMMTWCLVRLFYRLGADTHAKVLLTTRVPAQWEWSTDVQKERMYGSWPAYLESQHVSTTFVGYFEGSFRSLIQRQPLQDLIQRGRIILLELVGTWQDLLSAHFPFLFFIRYYAWHFQRRHLSVTWDGIPITPLWWDELSRNVWNIELASDIFLAKSWNRYLRAHPQTQLIFQPFEFQPLERAMLSGIPADHAVHAVGVQTGLWCTNQMGFSFLKEQVIVQSQARLDLASGRAPVPDALAAYGKLPYDVFEERLGKDRVCWSGPIRYEPAQITPQDLQSFQTKQGFSKQFYYVLVTTSIDRSESQAILEMAYAWLQKQPDAFLLIKTHYLNPMSELIQTFHPREMERIRIFQDQLAVLLHHADVVVTGGTSVAVEAIQIKKVPLIYRHPGIIFTSPLLDVPEAAYYWQTLSELESCMRSSRAHDATHVQRLAHREKVLELHFSPFDDLQNQRLGKFIKAHFPESPIS